MLTPIVTLETVTAEQIAKLERIVDMTTGRAFYLCQSSHYSENFLEYKIEAIRANGEWHVTCTCPAGNPPIDEKTGKLAYAPKNCWHKRAALAFARLERMQAKTEVQAAAPATVVLPESVPTLIVDGEVADELTTRRVMNAPAKEIDRKAKAPTTKAFSLLR